VHKKALRGYANAGKIADIMHTTLDLIKQLRSAGFSQMEISRRTGIPQSRLSRWEQGQTPVGADDALKLLLLVQTETLARSA
jgi:DNA-binding transcriptional regulator YiaG